MNKSMKDVLIIGTGPAGLSAGIYCKRYEMDVEIIGEMNGGTVTKTHLIENWPGEKSISGFELGMNLINHLKETGVNIKQGKVIKIEKKGDTYKTILKNGEEISSKTIIYATGTHHRELGIETEKEFISKGVSYCATCDGGFYKDKIVGVVGGSDSAVKEALLLSKYARKVYIIYRGIYPRAEPINLTRMEENDKIEVINKSNVTKLFGGDFLEGVILDNSGELKLDGLFIEIGSIPNSEIAKDLGVKVNEKGEIETDKNGKTNLKGFFSCGDVVNNGFRQAIVSAAQGSFAANSVYDEINK